VVGIDKFAAQVYRNCRSGSIDKRPHSTPDATSSFDHLYGNARLSKAIGGCESGKPSPDDQNWCSSTGAMRSLAA
jgi:hypothetical protein